jgi:hypothetical protein
MSAKHHNARHNRQAKAIRQAAYAWPDTRCWRCHLTIHEAAPHADGKPARWTAGHTGNDDELLPECSTCNYSDGARVGNASRLTTSQPW